MATNTTTDKNEIDLRRIARAIRSHRWIYLGGCALIAAMATAFCCITQPRYESTATMLIEDSSSEPAQTANPMAQMMRTFSIGGASTTSVDNEIMLVNTMDVMRRTVTALNLNTELSERHGLRKLLLFAEPPLLVGMARSVLDTLTVPVKAEITLHPDGKVSASLKAGKYSAQVSDAKLPVSIPTPLGDVTIAPGPSLDTASTDSRRFVAALTGTPEASAMLYKKVIIEIADKMSDAISLTITDVGRDRGRAILDEVMRQYNIKRLERTHLIAEAEIRFLDERIADIFSELTESEKRVEQFKTKANFISIGNEAPILLEKSLDSHEETLKTTAEIAYFEQILNTLRQGHTGLLPAVVIPGSSASAGSESGPNAFITAYNEQVMLRQELLRSAKPGNTALIAAEQRIDQLRTSIISSFTQLLEGARMAEDRRKGATGALDSHLHALPSYEREFMEIFRDNNIKNELYTFLLQKRENALLQYHSENTTGFIIDPAITALKPSARRPLTVTALALVAMLGFIGAGVSLTLRCRDRLADPFDLRRCGLEERTSVIDLTKPRDGARTLRSLITAGRTPLTIYTALIDAPGEAITAITDAMQRAGMTADIINDVTDNDTLLSPAFDSRAKAATSAGHYLFVEGPDPGHFDELHTLADADGAALLLIVGRNTTGRRHLIRQLEGFDPKHLIIAISTT